MVRIFAGAELYTRVGGALDLARVPVFTGDYVGKAWSGRAKWCPWATGRTGPASPAALLPGAQEALVTWHLARALQEELAPHPD